MTSAGTWTLSAQAEGTPTNTYLVTVAQSDRAATEDGNSRTRPQSRCASWWGTRSMMNSRARGFSLIELMMAIIVMMIVVGGIFGVIDVVNQRSSTEQAKLDMFQEAREFMDQMSRDLHQAGYPSPRHYLEARTSSRRDPVTNDDRTLLAL